MLTPFGYFDLIDEMTNSGCAICNLLVRDTGKMLETILYEYVTEPQMHRSFRSSRGLCNEHGWQLTKLGNAMSIAVLYGAVLDELIKTVRKNAPTGSSQPKIARRIFSQNSNGGLVDALEPDEPCPVCHKNNENEISYVGVFSDHLGDEKLQHAFRESSGLCLVHFQKVLQQTADVDNARFLVEIQAGIWEELRADLAEFVRKYDYKNVGEKMGKEGDSWVRAVGQIGGGKGVFGVRK